MKKQNKLIALLLCVILLLSATACGADEFNGSADGLPNLQPAQRPVDEEQKLDDLPPDTIVENPFIATGENNVSTISADVDTASYTYFRKMVNYGYSLSELTAYGGGASYRTEEFINYFRYAANAPKDGELFGTTFEIADCPWNDASVLLKMTLQAESKIAPTANNLVFLIDVSGSMSSQDKLPLLQSTFTHLVNSLTANDTVSIVTYSGSERVVLEGCAGNDRSRILSAIQSLTAYGSTHGEAGLNKAYQIAERYRIEGGNNRIIMASDGDLNVGISSADELTAYVEEKRDGGIFLSILGFGTGNYRDGNMEALADNGNGVYYYIDGETEAEKVFGSDLLSTLYTVAKDVKLQTTFDKSMVASYRLIGYENRLLDEDDFRDDKKDAGEAGAGHQVTVCYELVLTERAKTSDEKWLTLAVSYKHPDESLSQENQYDVGKEVYSAEPSEDLAFILSLIETVMVLHNSSYLGDITLDGILENLQAQSLTDPYRQEFRALVGKLVSK